MDKGDIKSVSVALFIDRKELNVGTFLYNALHTLSSKYAIHVGNADNTPYDNNRIVIYKEEGDIHLTLCDANSFYKQDFNIENQFTVGGKDNINEFLHLMPLEDEDYKNINDTVSSMEKVSIVGDNTLFEELCKSMIETHKAKNADYGDSFHKTIEEFGPIAGVIRLSDKMNRIKTLIKSDKQNVKDESITDTLLDMANYAVMLACEIKNK